ncbi:Sec-independent protein translocase protein TatB [Allosphingosinicella sp.]|uniref:Sec-independent protein translocase protein TatB n=1 Tax=Allosphingosinicella sp. TaxID=2823234 RepID=UPI002FC13806
MFDIAPTELLIVALVALVVIGPKDLPRVMRTVGHWVGKAKGMARHFRSGLDTMMREAELEEMEKKWKEENERVMREFPSASAPASPPAAQTEAPPPPPEGEMPPSHDGDDRRELP